MVKSINDALTNSERTEEEFPHKELLLESKPLTVAIWKDDTLFYVFDSKPRNKNGLAVNIEQWLDPSEMVGSPKKILIPNVKLPVPATHISEKLEPATTSKTQKSVTIIEDAVQDNEQVINVIDLGGLPEGEAAAISHSLEKDKEEEEGLAEE